MPDPIDFPVPRPLTPEEAADPTVRAVRQVSNDPEAMEAAWDALEAPDKADPEDSRFPVPK